MSLRAQRGNLPWSLQHGTPSDKQPRQGVEQALLRQEVCEYAKKMYLTPLVLPGEEKESHNQASSHDPSLLHKRTFGPVQTE
jgi:hypothetical protein